MKAQVLNWFLQYADSPIDMQKKKRKKKQMEKANWKMFKEKCKTELNDKMNLKEIKEKKWHLMTFINSKIKRIHSAHCAHKGKEVPSSPAEHKKQVACSGISRKRPRRTTLSFFYMVSRKEKQSCKMLKVLQV